MDITSVTNNSLSKGYPHPEDHDKPITDTPGFKPFNYSLSTICCLSCMIVQVKVHMEWLEKTVVGDSDVSTT